MKVEVGMVAGEGEDEVVGQGERCPPVVARVTVSSVMLRDRAGEVCGDLVVLDAVVDVGQDPVFDVAVHLRAAMHEGNARAVPPQFERGDGGGVFAADDQDVQAVVRMRLVVVVLDLGEVFAGNVQVVGQIVVAGGDDQLARAMLEGAAEAVGGVDGEVAVAAADGFDGLILADVEAIVLGDLAVVLQRLVAVGLLVGAGEGHVADLEQLRRGEEGHVRGIVEERVAEAALVHQARRRSPRAGPRWRRPARWGRRR